MKRLLYVMAVMALLFVAAVAFADDDSAGTNEREWPYPAALVKKNLEHLRAYEGARLPTLEGFIPEQVRHLELYEQPYYQYRITLTPIDANKTRVKVEAKITAYYADTRTAHSEYKTLPSNGRLESDLLERLGRALPSMTPTKGDSPSATPASYSNRPGATSSSQPSAPLHAAVGIGSAPASVSNSPVASLDQPQKLQGTPEQQLDAVLAQRQTIRDKSDNVLSQIQSIQSGKSAAKHVEFGAVRHSGVGVMSRTNYGGPVLFRAQADDEFEVLEVQGEWTKVSLGAGAGPNASGWIESDELNIPAGVLQAATRTSAPAPSAAAKEAPAPDPAPAAPSATSNKAVDLGFWVSREEVSKFAGEWGHLKGKSVLYVYAQPRGVLSDLASDDTRLAYAKRIFESRAQKADSAGAYEGVVVVFMGSKGGVAAATLGDIRQWVQGSIPEAAFMSRCSLDLPGQVAVTRAN
jgi:hypothetical protein